VNKKNKKLTVRPAFFFLHTFKECKCKVKKGSSRNRERRGRRETSKLAIGRPNTHTHTHSKAHTGHAHTRSNTHEYPGLCRSHKIIKKQLNQAKARGLQRADVDETSPLGRIKQLARVRN